MAAQVYVVKLLVYGDRCRMELRNQASKIEYREKNPISMRGFFFIWTQSLYTVFFLYDIVC